MAARPNGLSIWLHVLNESDTAGHSLEYLSWPGLRGAASLLHLFQSVLDFPLKCCNFPWGLYACTFWSKWNHSRVSPLELSWLLQYYCCCLVAQSFLTLCDPMDCSPPGSSVRGISQARILQRVAISLFGGSSQPRGWSCVSCTGRWILYLSHIAGLQVHRSLFMNLFVILSLVCGTLNSAPSLPVPSLQYHVFYP